MNREWRVYVFELDDSAGAGRVADKPNLYVGETAKTILERLGTHLTDHQKGSGKVRLHFRAIRFDLFEGLGPYGTRKDALREEAKLAEELRSLGYTVVNKTGEDLKFDLRPKST